MNLPDDTNRLAIVGKTGSGKTVGALWHLSQQNYDEMPWIIIDYKGDENINNIGGAQYLKLEGFKIPSEPGIYIVRPLPEVDDNLIDEMLWKIHAHGNVGIYVDEGYMIPRNSKGFLACLTQGRSKHIPMIVLSQRPSWISRFVFSEAEYIQIYALNDKDDRKRVEAFLPRQGLPKPTKYHAYYYDVSDDKLMMLSPVPQAERSIRDIETRLEALKEQQSDEKAYRLKIV